MLPKYVFPGENILPQHLIPRKSTPLRKKALPKRPILSFTWSFYFLVKSTAVSIHHIGPLEKPNPNNEQA